MESSASYLMLVLMSPVDCLFTAMVSVVVLLAGARPGTGSSAGRIVSAGVDGAAGILLSCACTFAVVPNSTKQISRRTNKG
jgi:hypothetical protein